MRDQKISIKSLSSLLKTLHRSDQRSPKTGGLDMTDRPYRRGVARWVPLIRLVRKINAKSDGWFVTAHILMADWQRTPFSGRYVPPRHFFLHRILLWQWGLIMLWHTRKLNMPTFFCPELNWITEYLNIFQKYSCIPHIPCKNTKNTYTNYFVYIMYHCFDISITYSSIKNM